MPSGLVPGCQFEVVPHFAEDREMAFPCKGSWLHRQQLSAAPRMRRSIGLPKVGKKGSASAQCITPSATLLLSFCCGKSWGGCWKRLPWNKEAPCCLDLAYEQVKHEQNVVSSGDSAWRDP